MINTVYELITDVMAKQYPDGWLSAMWPPMARLCGKA